jgi:hypothetical protein
VPPVRRPLMVDRVFPDRRSAGIATRRVCRTGPRPGREADRGSRRGRRTAWKPRCRWPPWPVSGPVPNAGISSRTAWLQSGDQARGLPQRGRPAAVQFAETWQDVVARNTHPRPGVTLSDTGCQEERSPSRHSDRL